MSIDRLSSTSSLIAALRAEVTRKSERAGTKAPTAGRAGQGDPVKRRDPSVLRRELAEILKNVAPDDVEAMNAARPRVVRAVLLWEFGAELREHAEWQPMLDTLVNTLEASDQHRKEFSGLIRELHR